MKFESVLDLIGNTPLVKLHKIVSGFECNVWAKCEFFNPGGSVKDRIAKSMIEEAEKCGKIKPGDTLIEPTSGNTGIGLALVSALKGYKVIITMPEKMSLEKEVVLRCLGADIIRTPTEEPSESPNSHIGVAKTISASQPSTHILDQYSNEANPLVHYTKTAEEILQDLDGQIDMFVASPGTGGTLTGVARKLKEVNPNCIIVGADPIGSILGGGNEIKPYLVEGIGYDFFPHVFDNSVVDYWVKVSDRDSFLTARKIIRLEGLLVGGSCGANMYAALKHLSKLKKNQNCVVMFPDGIRNYLSKFATDDWMLKHGFFDVDEEKLKLPLRALREFYRPVAVFQWCQKVSEVLGSDFELLLVLYDNKVRGVVEKKTLEKLQLMNSRLNEKLLIFVCDKNFKILNSDETLETYLKVCVSEKHVFISHDDKYYELNLVEVLNRL